jgi:hypothetical protein
MNPYIEQTTQQPEEKAQMEKQRFIKHTHKNKDRVTRTPLKTKGELMCSGMVSSSCFTSATRRVNLVTNPFKLYPYIAFLFLCYASPTPLLPPLAEKKRIVRRINRRLV